MADEKIILNDTDLEGAAGGKKHHSSNCKKSSYKCNECAKIGKMNVPLYKYNGDYICFENAHYFQGSTENYQRIDEDFMHEAAKHC